MFCNQCGAQNEPNAYKCTRCDAVLRAASLTNSSPALPLGTVPSNLVWAILVTLFCCLPTGIVAIVYAAQVDGRLAAGDLLGARQASSKAATWSWVSAGISIAAIVLYLVFVVGLAALGGAASSVR